MSFTIWSKSDVASGWNTMPATSRWVSSSEVSSVTCAVVIANSRSRAGCLTLVRPRIESRRPKSEVGT